MKRNQFVPQGVNDIYSDLYEAKENITNKITDIFKSYGYKQILTPTFEYYDVFYDNAGINRDKLFKFIDADGKILVLRPDVTTPIARMVGSTKSNDQYLKYLYATNVFRVNDKGAGQKREFMQAGIEFFGSQSAEADGEVIAIAIKTMLELGAEDFTVDIGQAAYFKGLLYSVPQQYHEKIITLVENKNFSDLETFLETLDIHNIYKEAILKTPYLFGSPDDVLARTGKYIFNGEMANAIENLKEIFAVLKDYGYEKYLSLDMGLISNMDYYTGVIFKGYMKGFGKEVFTGGRYDNLTKDYGRAICATGFGINIDELVDSLYWDSFDFGNKKVESVYVIYERNDRKSALEYCQNLRNEGKRVACGENSKENQMYAQSGEFSLVVVHKGEEH